MTRIRATFVAGTLVLLMCFGAGCGEGDLGFPDDEVIDDDAVSNISDGTRRPCGTCSSGGDYAPPSYFFAGVAEGYGAYQGQSTCDDTPKPGVKAFRDLVLGIYPCTYSGGISRACWSGKRSEHKEGRAWDWMISYPSPAADRLLGWLLATDANGTPHALARRFGIMYMIWNRRAWRSYRASEGWQPYTGKSPHTDHIHFSFTWNGAKRKTTFWTAPKGSCVRGPVTGAESELFKDMPSSTTAYTAARALYDKNITNGCSSSPLLFCPSCPLTRAEMAALLVRAVRQLRPQWISRFSNTAPSFSDVPSSHTLYSEIRDLAAAGITQGCGGGQFCPGYATTRGQMAAFLVRTMSWPVVTGAQTFSDVAATHRFYREIETLYANGVTKGCGASPPRYCPDAVVTRAEAALFSTRAFGI